MAKILRVTRHSEISSEQMEALQEAATNLVGPATGLCCGYCGTPVAENPCSCGWDLGAESTISREVPHEVVVHDQTVKDAAEVLALCEKHGAAVMEAVLPPAILADLTNPRVNTQGIPVIRAQMAREVDAAGNVTFTFVRYERILKVEVVTEPL
jgi:hypothetical protein